MTAAQKDTVYIDIDDEITSIIEKVESSEHKIVALVLPKRAAVLQSLVNMKLLKRSAEEAKKSLVLITSEASLLPLAGAVGVHVAKTLQSKPAIPKAPETSDDLVSLDEDETADGVDDVDLDKRQPIGALAGFPAAAEETIELDNTEDKALDEPKAKKGKKALNKKLKVPDFNKFRTRLFLAGGGLILLIVLWYMAAVVMPRAKIVLQTDTTNSSTEISFSTKPDATELNLEEKILPSKPQELKKTDTEKTAATGEKDNGTKATGTITIRNCDYSDGFTISAGATFTGGGRNFVSIQSVTVPKFTGSSGSCTQSGASSGKATVSVQASAPGEGYNIASTSFTVPGIPATPKVDAVGSNMTGGTTNIVKVVSQKDFDDAKKRIEERTNSAVEGELTKLIEDAGYYVLKESLIVGTPEFTSVPKVGEPGSEVTVTSNITYTMIGVMKDDLENLIKDAVKDQLQEGKQTVQSSGVDDAVLRLADKQPTGVASGTLQTIVVIGPQFDMDDLKKQVAGKKRSQTQEILKQQPGVKEVIIDYSPFWVFSTPKQTGKINITLEQANNSGDN